MTDSENPAIAASCQSPAVARTRIDYIDLLKGFTILWIIWIHTDCFPFGYYRVPVFFFASGIFFKITDFKEFFTKRIWMLIIPFVFFYVVSIPFRVIVDAWDSHTFDHFDWTRLLEVFSIEGRNNYLTLNIPLWFLLALFWIQAAAFVLYRLPCGVVLLLAVMSIVFFNRLNTFPSPLMMNTGAAWFGFFTSGYLYGRSLICILSTWRRRIIVFAVTLTAFIMLVSLFPDFPVNNLTLACKVKLLVFIPMMVSGFSLLDGLRQMEFLRYFGRNSLIVLGAHLWVLEPSERLIYKFTRVHSPWYGLLSTILAAVILVAVIEFLKRAVPSLVGHPRVSWPHAEERRTRGV